MIKRINNNQKDFYKYMGPIFGSRTVQRETSDRFYDDDEKEWILNIINKEIISVVSMKNNEIKNIYTKDPFSLIELLKMIYKEVKCGTVPIVYLEIYSGAGYILMEEYKNFVKIKGGMSVE